MINHIALVSETAQLDIAEVMKVAAAIGKQLARDFAPIWEIPATMDAFGRLEDVPTGYWPIMVMDDIDVPGAAGIHLDDDGRPFGLANYKDGWSLTVSHEALEMLGDPLGNTLRAGPSVHPDQDRVEYLVEVCDPSEAWEFGYDVNGVRVSDFYTPDFFSPIAATGVRYSFTDAIKKPRQVLKGGYLSWLDPATGNWWQQTWYSGAAPEFHDLGHLAQGAKSIREQIDRLSGPARVKARPLAPKKPQLTQRRQMLARSGQVEESKANRLRKMVASIVADAKGEI